MTAPSTEIATAVEALAGHICEEVSIKFGELAKYLKAHGIPIEGDEELTGEHVNQPHVGEYTTLLGSVSCEYVEIVKALFKSRPVTLEIGDPAFFAAGDEPWWVTWTSDLDARVGAAIEFVHDQGAVSFMDLADHLRASGVSTHGHMTMNLGRHAVGNGVVMTRPSNPVNVVLWNGGSAEFLRIIECMLKQEPRVVLERTGVDHYQLGGIALQEHYIDDGRPAIPLPTIDFGPAIATDGYEAPTWLPVLFAWTGPD